MNITKSLKLTAGPLMMLWHNQPKIRPCVHPARGRLEKETKFSQTRSIGSANQHACANPGESKHYSHKVMVEENPKTTTEQIDKSGQKPICKDNFLTAETQIYLFLTEDLDPLKYWQLTFLYSGRSRMMAFRETYSPALASPGFLTCSSLHLVFVACLASTGISTSQSLILPLFF